MRGVADVDDLKVHIDKLEDILQEVKKQNNMKDEEIRALRNKMVKMEKVLPLLNTAPEAKEAPASSKAPAEQWGDAVDQEEQVSKLMGDDDSFRRGRVRWMRQEQTRLKNLQQQEISRQLRRQSGPHRFIPPEDRKLRFPFRSNPKHRSSWSPGTHIIITDNQVIELKVPKEAVQEEEEEERPEGAVFRAPPLPSPPLLRKGRESEHRGQGPRNAFRGQPGRARSSSFNSSQKSASPARRSQTGDAPQPSLHILAPHQSCQADSISAGPLQTPTEQPSQQHQNHLLPPPRMRRQLSAPNLKAGRETPV
ncbi:kinesin-like protein KIF1C [Brienomyrus brachyistius]|uniref:kinesin-like protein KIF1C n=1 Tax=Brienomyrus brachyistius TaxID=42636 RepID=UPI0020B33FCC|nr:kinesin-like protein KIF1C [Brienomyrus brachyistius]